jgi:heme exporter protein C
MKPSTERTNTGTSLDRWIRPLGWLTALSLGLGLLASFVYAPTERAQGNVQRIFYLHIPLAWLAFFAFFIVFVASILFLWKRTEIFDQVAHSAAEIGLLFTTLMLISGSLWGRPIWGTWWTWDARLTTTLMLWFIYAAYLTLRGVLSDNAQSARYSAILGIVGLLDVPIIHQSVVWWRTLHPQSVVLAEGGPAMPPAMLQTLGVTLVAFTLLFFWLLLQRVKLERALAERRLTRIEHALSQAA